MQSVEAPLPHRNRGRHAPAAPAIGPRLARAHRRWRWRLMRFLDSEAFDYAAIVVVVWMLVWALIKVAEWRGAFPW
ncbi:MAG: hypothetical protein ACYCT1_08205 [Steroidobacteraceae bacterium]